MSKEILQRRECMKKLLMVLTVIMFVASFAWTEEFPCQYEVQVIQGTGWDITDKIEEVSVTSYEPVWKSLENMTQGERENSEIELILEENISSQSLQMLNTIENLWNSGRFEDALLLFPELEKLTDIDEMAIGNTWRIPVVTEYQPDWFGDVRIGNRDSIYQNEFDIHLASGNLFAILLYEQGSGTQWSVNLSTNGGASWTEAYTWSVAYDIGGIAPAVVEDHCYVGYIGSSGSTTARLRRFKYSDASSDTFDNGASNLVVYTASSAINEISLVSNQDYYNNRLYYYMLVSDGNLRYFWASDVAVSWNTVSTGITNAAEGLDACCNEGYADYFTLFSYYNTSNQIRIFGNDGSSINSLYSSSAGTGNDFTAIGAYHDTILCAYDYYVSPDRYIRYVTSYNGGTNFYWGTFGSITTTQESPDLTCRNGGGEGVIFRFYSSPRELRYTWRNYAGSWSTHVPTTEHTPYWNKPCIEYLPGSSVFGVVYLCWNSPQDEAAYFTRSDWVSGIEENISENLTDSQVFLTPNPSRGIATLSYVVKTEGTVNISLFDASGRLINTVINEIKSPGVHTTTIDNQSLASGTYFVNIKTPEGVNVKPMMIVK